jgi:hypothetical protein
MEEAMNEPKTRTLGVAGAVLRRRSTPTTCTG